MNPSKINFENKPLWVPLASIVLALSWLLPNASPPWNAFHKDLLSAAVMLVVASTLLIKNRADVRPWKIDAVAMVLLVLAAGALGQWAFAKIYFLGVAAMGFAYFSATAILVVTGRYWEDVSPSAIGNFIFSGMVIAAFLTSALMFKQWLGMEGLDAWVQYLPRGGRPYGNLMQPNNAASLLLLGLIGLVWASNRGFLKTGIVTALGLPLLIALVLAQSRIAMVTLTILLLAGWVRAKYFKQNENWQAVFLIWALAFLVLLWFMPFAFQWLEIPLEPSLIERVHTETRGLAYRAYWQALLDAPLTGYGFGQTVLAQIAAGGLGYELPGLFNWTHNFILDVGIWFGMPAMVLLVAAGIWFLIKLMKAQFESDIVLYAAALFVVFMHSLVELPHTYAYFLLPCSLFLGALCQRISIPSWKISTKTISVALIGAAVLLTTIAFDYIRVENAFYTWRFKQAKIGTNHPIDIPKVVLLDQLEAFLIGVRAIPGNLTDKQLNDFEKAAILEPSAASIQSAVIMLLHASQIDRAQTLINRSRFLFSLKERKALASSWEFLSSQDSRYNLVSWPQ